MSNQLQLTIAEVSQVAEARRSITDLANKLNFNETQVGKVAIIVTEAATNLLKHATEGQILARPLEQAGSVGLEILALDQGPGLTNVSQALNDGYSTAGSPGTGLGAIIRLSTVFDIHSQPEKGTALLSQLWPQNGSRPVPGSLPPPLEVGAVCLAKHGQVVSGDNWAVRQSEEQALIMVADGLGHGLEAAIASLAATEILSRKPLLKPTAVIEAAHAALSHTRGAALAVVELDLARAVLRFVGIGNIAGTILGTDRNHHLASHNGIVGHQIRKITEFTYPWSADAFLLLHSDGLITHWDLKSYPGLLSRHPSLIAGVLYRDFNRGNDDVTVLVIRQNQRETF
jgi:anti-sigma regulatory factor (Ser/Thr protein kinase)/serine/threonine protein phosphatase PrpC